MCGGGDAVKRVFFRRNFVNKATETSSPVRPYRECVLWSNGLGSVSYASVKGEESQKVCGGR